MLVGRPPFKTNSGGLGGFGLTQRLAWVPAAPVRGLQLPASLSSGCSNPGALAKHASRSHQGRLPAPEPPGTAPPTHPHHPPTHTTTYSPSQLFLQRLPACLQSTSLSKRSWMPSTTCPRGCPRLRQTSSPACCGWSPRSASVRPPSTPACCPLLLPLAAAASPFRAPASPCCRCPASATACSGRIASKGVLSQCLTPKPAGSRKHQTQPSELRSRPRCLPRLQAPGTWGSSRGTPSLQASTGPPCAARRRQSLCQTSIQVCGRGRAGQSRGRVEAEAG